MRFIVESEVFGKLENVCFGVVIAKGVDNFTSIKDIKDLLDESASRAYDRFKEKNIKEDPFILPYRESFVKLDINPNKYLSSIEALVKRAAREGNIPHINNTVDLANAISLKYLLPLGTHDIENFEADISVRFSKDGDIFIPFGHTEAEVVEESEMIYAVGRKIKTRRWIWRQSEIGKIIDKSTDIFFPIDGFKGVNDQSVLRARDELEELLREFFSCKTRVGFIDSNNQSFEL